MQWEFVVAMIIAIPLVLIPVAIAWYLNLGGLFKMLQRRIKGAEVKGIVKAE